MRPVRSVCSCWRAPSTIPQVGSSVLRLAAAPPAYARYLRDRTTYRRLPEAEPLRWRDAFPRVHDRLPSSPYDSHYFFQDTWAANRIAERRPARHVDVGSRVDYVGFLTAICEVEFVDIRPLEVALDRLTCVSGSLLDLPYADHSIDSLSCLHVAEHVGLGRYGDPLDPAGTRRRRPNCSECSRRGGSCCSLARWAGLGCASTLIAFIRRARSSGCSTGSSSRSSAGSTTRAASGAIAGLRSWRTPSTPAECSGWSGESRAPSAGAHVTLRSCDRCRSRRLT